jgi:chromosome segregation ATPase
MDVEKTIEFIMEHQAQAEVRMERLDRNMERLEHALSQTNRVVNQLVRYGVSLRSDVRRLDKAMAHLAEVHAETDEKLNALIDLVDRTIRGNGK